MATAAEQWVLVEMVQALYEVSAAVRAPATPAPGKGRRVRAGGPRPRGPASASPDRGVPAGRARGRAPSSGGEGRGTAGAGPRPRFALRGRSPRGPVGAGWKAWEGPGEVVLDGRVAPGAEGTGWEALGSQVFGTVEQEKGEACGKLKFVFIGA